MKGLGDGERFKFRVNNHIVYERKECNILAGKGNIPTDRS